MFLQLEGLELKLQHFHNDVIDKTQWITDTETLLKSPAFNLDDESISSDKVQQQSELVEVTLDFGALLQLILGKLDTKLALIPSFSIDRLQSF